MSNESITNTILSECLYALVLVPVLLSTSVSVFADSALPLLTLQQAEEMAVSEEPGLISQQWRAKSLMERSVADGQLMDPKLQLGLLNMPTNTFDLDQEDMTQFKISYLQQFPAGDTLDIKQQKTRKQSELIQTKMADRHLTILKDVRLTYLEIYYWEQARNTLVKNKDLFAQLVDIVQSLFSVGRNDQQDLIRAQLELSRLDDRLTKVEQKINTQRSRLARWIGSENGFKTLAGELPELFVVSLEDDFESLSQQFLLHPKIQQIDKQLEITRKEIELVDQSLKPGWGLNVGYSYRQDRPDGSNRADFLTAAVTFDLPLFSSKRQDKKRLSSEHEYQALKNQRVELLRQLVAELQQEKANEILLIKRQQLYNKLLLPQAKQQRQASLLAYQSDRGAFSDVMRAYMDELNANLDERRIAIDLRQTQAKLLYFVPTPSVDKVIRETLRNSM